MLQVCENPSDTRCSPGVAAKALQEYWLGIPGLKGCDHCCFFGRSPCTCDGTGEESVAACADAVAHADRCLTNHTVARTVL